LGRETKNKPLFYIYDDGTVDIEIDYSNQKMEGSFDLNKAGSPAINCTFSNVPFTLHAL
tara:strand:+ start:463 stop:639 length:177 start_codon:yes stop_codon:yes gene_type:complete